MSSLPLAGKVAIVTGASRSIGAALAIRLARDGAKVVINYVSNSAAADEVVSAISGEGKGEGFPVKADISTAAGRQLLIDETLKKWQKIDILVNNAGIMLTKTLEQADETNFDTTFNLNVKTPLFLSKLAVPHMAPGSRIILFSSSLTLATTVLPNNLIYVASKGAVEQLTRVLSKDLATKLITVNCVSPGPTDTPLFREGKPESVINMIKGYNPHNRLGTVEDVAGIVTFLAGPESSWISGQNIRVNGAFAV
ncbi:hypothetical protein M422DRAFT_30811 [Sphaerobolus stellatus SS14]|uniref:3-oxoacyl-[acyl-carrier-protein] reductase n=1 Tax=Sphaerobolus stellatus (strain SS14) TaxID=990650 RepID=A0A0C9VNG2_SPHS4|nr:hypothetical protein M422DRAFT_30811 [Sphaerobolus stellatus SS14]